jgi:hypothetical protein
MSLLSDVDERRQRELLLGQNGYYLRVANSEHAEFSDRPFLSLRQHLIPSNDPERVQRVVASFALAFFRSGVSGTFGTLPSPLLSIAAARNWARLADLPERSESN